MFDSELRHLRFTSVRPLVRYVDEGQAVVEAHVSLQPRPHARDESLTQVRTELHIYMVDPEGRPFEYRSALRTEGREGAVRFEMPSPKRWWPAGMGDQPLYGFKIVLLVDDEAIDSWESTLGLTSVRLAPQQTDSRGPAPSRRRRLFNAIDCTHPHDQSRMVLLINGRECSIHSIVPVYPTDEAQVLPAAGDALLVVHGHFGPNVLYEAADRAGILLIQSVPAPSDRGADLEVQAEIDRLARHPSLAGWYVEPDPVVGDRMANTIHQLDPTRRVFRCLPND
jgi:beta-galactosidase/beta-glucuronidase